MSDLTFEPPGPGAWRLDTSHFPRPVSRYAQELMRTEMEEATKQGRSLYGFIYDIRTEFVNGFMYGTTQPVEGATNPDSTSTAGEETEYQRRVKQAAKTFETNRWRTELEQWDAEWKPAIRSTNRALQDVTPANLDDDQLIHHINECRKACIEHLSITYRVLPAYVVPLGDFLDHARQWTDRSPSDVLALLDGETPESLGALDRLQTVVASVESSAEARQLLYSDNDPETIIQGLRSYDGGVSEAMEDWLDIVGYRIISGFDVADHYALERPATLVNVLRTAIDGDFDGMTNTEIPTELEEIRREIPSKHRDMFDNRLEEARRTYRIRDERVLCFLSTLGLVRRALLEAGRRLTDRGHLRNLEHVVELEHDEVIAALRGGPPLSAAEVAVHAKHRQNHDVSDAPDHLGSDQGGSIPRDELPDPVLRLMRAGEALFGWGMGGELESDKSEPSVITGHAASPGTYEGPARVISDPENFSDVQDGDVLVAEMTTPAFNVLLPMVGAVVTDRGGMLSHPAIVAREFGIPGVVGSKDATDRIADGDHLAVDGEEGTVRIVSTKTSD